MEKYGLAFESAVEHCRNLMREELPEELSSLYLARLDSCVEELRTNRHIVEMEARCKPLPQEELNNLN